MEVPSGHGDRIAVVLHEKQYRQAFEADRVEGFPELALGGGPFAAGNDGDVIGMLDAELTKRLSEAANPKLADLQRINP